MKLRPLKRKWDKKANMPDIILFPVIIFANAVVLFILYFMWIQMQEPLTTGFNSTNADSAAIVNDTMPKITGALKLFDTLFPLFMVGVILSIIISAFFIRTYPFLFFISLLLWIVAIFIAVVMANVHSTAIRENPAFASVVGDFNTTNYIVNRLPIITLVLAIVVSIILYSKLSGYAGTGGGI